MRLIVVLLCGLLIGCGRTSHELPAPPRERLILCPALAPGPLPQWPAIDLPKQRKVLQADWLQGRKTYGEIVQLWQLLETEHQRCAELERSHRESGKEDER